MTLPVSHIVGAKPAIAWFTTRFPSLDPRTRTGGGGAAGWPDGSPYRAPVAPGVAQGFSEAPSQADQRPELGLRGWIEDRLLVELGDRLLSPPQQLVLPNDHISAVRAAILHLDGIALHADALRVLTEAVTGHDALQQGRHALQGV